MLLHLPRLLIQLRPVHPVNPQRRVLAEAARVLDQGGVVAVPTDTVYGLVCDPQSRRAVERVYRMRRLDDRKPLALLCQDLADVSRYAVVDDFAFRMLRRLLPGPYCVVLPAGREAPRLLLTTKRRQIGLRIPDSAVCLELLRAFARPLCVTSAIPPDTDQVLREAEEFRGAFPDVDLVLDAGVQGDLPSTVLRFEDATLSIDREGKGALEELGAR